MNLRPDNLGTAAVIAFAASVLIALPVLIWGIPQGSADLIHHLQIVNTYLDSFRSGHFQPDWNAFENLGYGDVTVRFYPPLMHITIAFFVLVSGSWLVAVLLAFVFWSFVGAFGMICLAKELLGNLRLGIVAGVIFLLTPYHLNQFYNSGMYGEYAGLSVLPFCVLMCKKVCDNVRPANIALFGASVALLILSNIPQTVVGAVAVGIFALFFLERTNLLRQVAGLLTGALLGAAASSFYWIRVVKEMSWINISQPNTDPLYDYRNHFLFADLSLDASGLWFAFAFFAASLAIISIALIASGKLSELMKHRELRPLMALTAVSIFMAVPLSRPLWDNIDLLQRVQFPWRFLSVFSLGFSVIFAFTLGFITADNLRRYRPHCIVLIGLFCIFATFSVKQVILGAIHIEPGLTQKVIDEAIPAKGLWHWRPTWVDEKAFGVKEKVLMSSRESEIRHWEPGYIDFTVTAGPEADARLAVMYYPYWKATVNDEPASVRPSEDGAASITVPASDSKVVLEFVEPQYTYYARAVSALAWMIILIGSGTAILRRNKSLS